MIPFSNPPVFLLYVFLSSLFLIDNLDVSLLLPKVSSFFFLLILLSYSFFLLTSPQFHSYLFSLIIVSLPSLSFHSFSSFCFSLLFVLLFSSSLRLLFFPALLLFALCCARASFSCPAIICSLLRTRFFCTTFFFAFASASVSYSAIIRSLPHTRFTPTHCPLSLCVVSLSIIYSLPSIPLLFTSLPATLIPVPFVSSFRS